MSKVYVLESTKLDISSASKFGELTYVFNNKRVSIWDKLFSRRVIEKLQDCGFNPRYDHFAVVGAMVPMALVVAQLVSTYGFVSLLLFSSSERSYTQTWVGDITHEQPS